jgi:beta-lactamase regulating signal transducer with metallopeptidase domain
MVTTLLTSAIDTSGAFFRQPAAQAVAWALLQFLWQGTALGAVTGLALFGLRRGASDIRYVVASIGMALMLTLPVVTGVQKYQALRSANASAAANAVVFHDGTLVAGGERFAFDRLEWLGAARPATQASGAVVQASREEFAAIMRVCFVLWMVGVAVLTLRLITGWIWIQRMRSHGVRPAAPAWELVLAHLSRQLHIRRTIALLESTRVDVPTVIGWLKPVVLLPASAIAALSPAQLEAILAHELAHIRRHDYLVNLLQTVVETLLFYHPAVWWISRRIRIERENCCDDLAVSLCGDPVAYANALADLESLRSSIAPFRRLDGPAMAATGGSLLQRVRRLLGVPTAHSGVRPTWLAASAALLIVGGMTVGAHGITSNQGTTDAAPTSTADAMSPIVPRSSEEAVAAAAVHATPAAAATAAVHDADARQGAPAAPPSPAAPASPPAPAAPPAPAVPAGSQNVYSNTNDTHGNWSWSNNGQHLQADYAGTFDFTDDDADVRQMSSGGRLRVSDGQWEGTLGRMFSTPPHLVDISERNGQIEHRYFVNGSERPFEPEGRAWLRENLPKFVRNTGVNAPARVGRLLKSGGVAAVLTEIRRVDGNYVRGIYYRELFKQATLSPDQYRDVLGQASSQMKGANYELSQLLISVADRLPNDEASRAAYFNAARNITGAYEIGRVYSTMLKKGGENQQNVAGILDHLKTLHSDYEVSQLLLQVMAQQPLDAHNGATLLDVAAGMHGDYERGRVLTGFLKQNSIEGDLRAPFFRAVDAVRGAYERGQILHAVVSKPDVSRDTLKLAIQATRTMPPYETSQLLLNIANHQNVTGDLRDIYIDAADRLGAYEQGQVMTALVRSERRSR